MRGRQAFILLTLYLGLISLYIVLIYNLLGLTTSITWDPSARQDSGKAIFGTVVLLELLLISFIAPGLTAGAITSERERQTYEILRTTLVVLSLALPHHHESTVRAHHDRRPPLGPLSGLVDEEFVPESRPIRIEPAGENAPVAPVLAVVMLSIGLSLKYIYIFDLIVALFGLVGLDATFIYCWLSTVLGIHN